MFYEKPEKIQTPQLAAENASEFLTGSVASLGAFTLSAMGALRVDSHIESIGLGIVAGITLSGSVLFGQKALEYRRRALELTKND
jgi:hypothetical protein